MASKYSRGFESAARWPKTTSSRWSCVGAGRGSRGAGEVSARRTRAGSRRRRRQKNVGEVRLNKVRARQDARRGDAPAGHPRSFPWSHPRAGGCSCSARPLPRRRAPRVSRTPTRPRHERAPRSSPRPTSRFLPLFLIPRPTRAPRFDPARRSSSRARRTRGTPSQTRATSASAATGDPLSWTRGRKRARRRPEARRLRCPGRPPPRSRSSRRQPHSPL